MKELDYIATAISATEIAMPLDCGPLWMRLLVVIIVNWALIRLVRCVRRVA